MIFSNRLNSNLKLSFSVIFLIIFSLTILYLVNDWFLSENDTEKLRNPIFTENLTSEGHKVFILGNSHVNRLNKNFLNEYVAKQGFSHEVYIMPVPGSRPSDRLPILNSIISTKPDLVIIGIDPWDLRDDWNISKDSFTFFERNSQSLFDPQSMFKELIPKGKFYSIDMYNLKNPKLTTLRIIDEFTENNTNENQDPEATNRSPSEIASKSELAEMLKSRAYDNRISYQNNFQVSSLEKIVSDLNKNEISVVILVTPRPQEYINSIAPENLEEFNSVLKNLGQKYQIPVYSLLTKYADLNIWWDLGHITRDPSGLIYSEDVAKIIVENIYK